MSPRTGRLQSDDTVPKEAGHRGVYASGRRSLMQALITCTFFNLYAMYVAVSQRRISILQSMGKACKQFLYRDTVQIYFEVLQTQGHGNNMCSHRVGML